MTVLWRDPSSLAALVLVAGLAAFLVWAGRRRARALATFVATALQPTVVPDVDPRRRGARAVVLVSAAALLVVALAGPMWGFRWEQVRRQGIDLVVAIDTSRSMLATDVKPDRLVRAKLAVRDLVAAARGDRLALVPFAGTAFLQCPLTLDRGAFLQSLDAVEVGLIPRGGTALAAAIDTSLAAFEGRQANHQAVILITDGESNEGDLDAAVARAKERGVRIYTVGIGTPEGELLPAEGGGFVKDRRGQVVKSRLDRATLERIARDTGGVYLHAAGAGLGLPELYRDHIATLDARALESTLERRFEHRYQLPLAVAFVLLLIEPLIGARRGRGSHRGGAAAAVLLAGVSVGWFDPHAGAREAKRLYDAGDFDAAAQSYNQALVDDPDSTRLHFGLGAARYQAGKYDEALASFAKAAGAADDPARAARLAYNLGNTRYRQGAALESGEPQQALAAWGEALAAYRRALAADPGDADARWNHELVERRIAALREKLEQQEQQQQEQRQQDEPQAGDQGQPGDQGRQDDEAARRDAGEEQPQQAEQQRDEEAADTRQPEQRQDETEQRQAGAPEDTRDELPAASDAARADGKMTPREAAALLDAQRAQEVQPGDIVRRLQDARVAEPAEDW
jgi:Ca-activated chloride channel family protein